MLTGGIHTHYSAGHRVWETEAESRTEAVSPKFGERRQGWQVEGRMNYWMYVVSFMIIEGWKR